MIHDTTIPSNMLALIRRPTSMPDPSDSRLQLTPTPVVIITAVPARVTEGNHAKTRASSVINMTAADAIAPIASARAANRASEPRPSSTMSVSPAANPSAYVSFSSTTKCWRMGTASRTPSNPAEVSHMNDCIGVNDKLNDTVWLALNISKAASSTHMNAVWAAAVPAVWTILFSQRL